MKNSSKNSREFYRLGLKGYRRQRGISLFVTIVFVMLSMLLALWSFKTSMFNELVIGNDADYQRAYEAAQALLQDAEFDIQGVTADGSACVATSDTDVCRPENAGTTVWFPTEDKEFGIQLVPTLSAAATSEYCLKGICLKRTGKQDFWNDTTTLGKMQTQAARYGQYTGAVYGGESGSTAAGIDPILKDRSTGKGGWYWVEVLPYDPNAGNTGLITNGSTAMALSLVPNVAFRITAMAMGLKKNTQVVLQSTYVLKKTKD